MALVHFPFLACQKASGQFIITVEALFSGGFIGHLGALHKALHLAFKKVVDGAFHWGSLHLGLKLVAEHTIELLNIMLHEGINRVPPKGLGQLRGSWRTQNDIISDLRKSTKGKKEKKMKKK